MKDVVEKVLEWYCASAGGPLHDTSEICSTRDIFQARLDTFYRQLVMISSLSEDASALLVAVVGEVGNNCFDHNLGQWPDTVGCWFSWLEGEKEVLAVVADRGQGVLKSLKRVKPDLATETEALHIAFEHRISGRSPEQRGNGLKFVCSVINGNKERELVFFSGSESLHFGGGCSLDKMLEKGVMKQKQGTGTAAFFCWEKV